MKKLKETLSTIRAIIHFILIATSLFFMVGYPIWYYHQTPVVKEQLNQKLRKMIWPSESNSKKPKAEGSKKLVA